MVFGISVDKYTDSCPTRHGKYILKGVDNLSFLFLHRFQIFCYHKVVLMMVGVNHIVSDLTGSIDLRSPATK